MVGPSQFPVAGQQRPSHLDRTRRERIGDRDGPRMSNLGSDRISEPRCEATDDIHVAKGTLHHVLCDRLTYIIYRRRSVDVEHRGGPKTSRHRENCRLSAQRGQHA